MSVAKQGIQALPEISGPADGCQVDFDIYNPLGDHYEEIEWTGIAGIYHGPGLYGSKRRTGGGFKKC